MAYAPFNLTGKVALVTGGNGGIGLGMADAMAAAGPSIVIRGTNGDKGGSFVGIASLAAIESAFRRHRSLPRQQCLGFP